MPGDDQALDLAGAFADGHQAGIAVDALNGILAGVAVATVDLDGIATDAFRHLGGEQFCHGGVLDIVTALSFQPGGVVEQTAGGLDLGGSIGKHPLNGLELRDGLAEGLSFFGIRQSVLERGLGQPERKGADAEAPAIEGGKRLVQALTFGADQIGRGDAHIFIGDRMGGRAMQSHLLFGRGDRQAGRIGGDEDLAQGARAA